jgi:hypothetical protein
MNIGGTLMGLFGIVTGLIYISRALSILFDVPDYLNQQEEDDALYHKDDMIW